MPAFDGSGPRGFGPMTGRGLGYCSGVRVLPRNGYYGRGRGFGGGYGRGFGRGFGYGYRDAYVAPYETESYPVASNQKEWLIEQKEVLENELKEISNQLDKLKDKE